MRPERRRADRPGRVPAARTTSTGSSTAMRELTRRPCRAGGKAAIRRRSPTEPAPPMTQASANVNIMIKAARKAARSLLRDFGEVENLQVSSKGPGDFVSRADIKAEQLIRDELTEARPNYGWLGEESVEVEGRRPDPALDRRPARRHDQLPARPAALGGVDRASSTRARSWPAWSTTRSRTRCSSPRRAPAPSSTTAGCGSPGGAT